MYFIATCLNRYVFMSITQLRHALFFEILVVRRSSVGRPSDGREKYCKKRMAQLGNRYENIPINTSCNKIHLLLALGVRRKMFTFLDHIFELLSIFTWRSSVGRPTDEQIFLQKFKYMIEESKIFFTHP